MAGVNQLQEQQVQEVEDTQIDEEEESEEDEDETFSEEYCSPSGRGRSRFSLTLKTCFGQSTLSRVVGKCRKRVKSGGENTHTQTHAKWECVRTRRLS